MTEDARESLPIARPGIVVLVEGKDEEILFTTLLKHENLEGRIQIRKMGGRDGLSGRLKGLTLDPGRSKLSSIGIVLDADNDAERSFQKACDALRNAKLPVPTTPLEPAISEQLRATVMVVPLGRPCGMLEDVFLESVADDPAMTCVDEFFGCLARVLPEMPRPTSKALLRSFLTSWEILEESHWDFVAAHLPEWVPQMPIAPSAEKVHAFLASRPKPTLNLGIAAEAGYWNLDHPAFDPLKAFLQSL